MNFKRSDFPDGFVFGAATAAYQIEGHKFGDAGSTHWDTFSATPGNVVRAENGDLANWMIPGKMVKGMGGAMDLVAGVKKVVVIMDHNARDGSAKFLENCSLPLTGVSVVDMIISDVGVFVIEKNEPTLIELAPDISIDDVKERTEAKFKIGKHLLPL